MALRLMGKMPMPLCLYGCQYYLYVLECIERGEREIEDGKTLIHAEVESRLATWLQ